MSPRSRFLAFGSAGLVVLAGAVCAVVVAGFLGQVLATVLISTGLVAVTALVFLEVGLSEDRERAKEDSLRQRRAKEDALRQRRAKAAAAVRRTSAPRSRRPRWSRRPG